MQILSYFKADVYGNECNNQLHFEICQNLDRALGGLNWKDGEQPNKPVIFADLLVVIRHYFAEAMHPDVEFLTDSLTFVLWGYDETGAFNWSSLPIEIDWIIETINQDNVKNWLIK